VPATAGQLLGGLHDGDLVAIQARLQDVVPTSSGFRLIVRSAETLFEASLEEETATPVPYGPGSLLELVGVAVVREEPGEGAQVRLLVRSRGDVRVLERAPSPWWNGQRVTWALGGLGGVLVGAFAWGATLRRQVRARTRDLRERSEHEARVETQIRAQLEEMVAERSRELAELKVRLVREERMSALGKLTTIVSHELRNPLATIRGSLFLIEETLPDAPARVKRALERAERGVRRSDEIISELLDYSRTRPVEMVVTDVDGWLSRRIADITLPPGIVLARDFASGATARVDGPRLLRCIINLVMNAAEAITAAPAGQNGSRIELSTRCAGDRVEIRVQDDGPGIPADLQAQVFEPFFSTKSFGVGLGLALVRQIMEQHRGGVSLVSRPGETAFTLWLPVCAAPAEPAPGRSDA
jgi:signal transduction histidine kinase